MAKIIPSLDLNKTPQNAESYSLVMAKNIKLLPDGTLGPDSSFEEIETKTGTSFITNINKPEITKSIVDYQYTLLNANGAILVNRDGQTLNDSQLEQYSFNFDTYKPTEVFKERSDDETFNKTSSDLTCKIYVKKLKEDSAIWSEEEFVYNPNDNVMETANGYRLAIAINSESYKFSNPLVAQITDYEYIAVPKETFNEVINLKDVSYNVVNPTYYTTSLKTVVIQEARNETIRSYDTLRYIHQIIGIDNKIYFIKESNYLEYNPTTQQILRNHYPNEVFLTSDNSTNPQATLSVDSEGFVTRRRERIDDKGLAIEATPEYNNRVRIFEFDENTKEFKVIRCAWSYNGGEIDGCVTINNTGEPILTIAEYNVPNNKLVPLKHINLVKCSPYDDESCYTQAPNIPITNVLFAGSYVKQIPAGVYQFFIRYKIHKNFYTNWFPCSKEFFAGSTQYTNTLQGTLRHYNHHKDSDKSFVFTIQHLYPEYCKNYEEFQLGFIISAEGASLARSWKHFKMVGTEDTTVYFDYNKADIEEINIDDLTKTNFELYNVGNITSYKNRLYISNYTETDFNEDLSSFTKDIKIRLKYENFTNDANNWYFDENLLNTPHESGSDVFTKYGNTSFCNSALITKDNYIDVETVEEVDREETVIGWQRIEQIHYENSIHAIWHNNPSGNNEQGGYVPTSDLDPLIQNRIHQLSYIVNGRNYYPYETNPYTVLEEEEDGSNISGTLLENDGPLQISVYARNSLWWIINGIDVQANIYITDRSTTRLTPVWEYEVLWKTFRKETTISDEFDNGTKRHVTTTWYRTIHKLRERFSIKPNLIKNQLEIINTKYNTLMPFTKYDFYIHFVKQNGIATNGYFVATKEVKNLARSISALQSQPSGSETITILPTITDWDLCDLVEGTSIIESQGNYYSINEPTKDNTGIIYPIFDNVRCPKGYVGYFFSIDKYGSNVAQLFNAGGGLVSTAMWDCLELDTTVYNSFDSIIIKNSNGKILTKKAKYYPSGTTDPITSLGCSGNIVANTSDFEAGVTLNVNNKQWLVLEGTNKLYNKNLLKITPILKADTQKYETYDHLNTPGYFCFVSKLNRRLCNTLIEDDRGGTGYYVSGTDVYNKPLDSTSHTHLEINNSELSYNTSTPAYIISNFNMNYVQLSEDLPVSLRSYEVPQGEYTVIKKQMLTMVNSLICSYILVLDTTFKDYIRKYYYEYKTENKTRFDNVIRTSNVDVDEAYRYIYRFDAADYYNVPTHRGIITNIFSISNSVYVHTKHSLFKFADNRTLNSEHEQVTLQESDLFNSGIAEVFDAEHGFGGLKDKRHSLITFKSYIFYDETAKTIYLYGGENELGEITSPVRKMIDSIKPTDVRFLSDELNNRIFVNFKTNNGNVCLSYSALVKSFISVHDFDFDIGFSSRSHSYIVHENLFENRPIGWSIYRITDKIVHSTNKHDQPQHPTVNSDTLVKYAAYQGCYRPSLIHVEDCDDNIILNSYNCVNSCVDIIVNDAYETVKVLDCLEWICSQVLSYESDNNNIAESKVNRLYGGNKIRIYTDSTETQLIELLLPGGVLPKLGNWQNQNDPTSWQYPVYNKGIWRMNYFRDVKNLDDVFKYKSPNNQIDLIERPQRLNLTQENSLIYGKYFVIRFIFNNRNFKLENVIANIKRYE